MFAAVKFSKNGVGIARGQATTFVGNSNLDGVPEAVRGDTDAAARLAVLCGVLEQIGQ
jgi:hypothetical protein